MYLMTLGCWIHHLYAVRCTRMTVAFAQNMESQISTDPGYVFVLNGAQWIERLKAKYTTLSATENLNYIAAFRAAWKLFD
ncbi:hypothetical protein Tco_0363073 [Tanacetum coccineum]